MKDGIGRFRPLAMKRPLDESDRIRLAQREWCVAAENEMGRVYPVGLEGGAQTPLQDLAKAYVGTA